MIIRKPEPTIEDITEVPVEESEVPVEEPVLTEVPISTSQPTPSTSPQHISKIPVLRRSSCIAEKPSLPDYQQLHEGDRALHA